MLEAEVEERLKKAPRVATADMPFFAADNDSEWRVSGKQSAKGKKKKTKAAVSKPKPKPAKQKRQQQQQQHKWQRQQQQVDVAGLQGGDTEWLDDVDINQLQQHMHNRTFYYRSGFPEADYYPLAADTMVEAIRRYLRGERSTKVMQVFERRQIGCWILNLRGNHWVVLFLDGRNRRGYYFDSLGSACPRALERVLDDAASKVRASGDDFDAGYDWVFHTNGKLGQTAAGLPLQMDGYQCGIWAITAEGGMLEFIATGQDCFCEWLREKEPAPADVDARKAFIAEQRTLFRAIVCDTTRAQTVSDEATLQACLDDDGIVGKLQRQG
eukprot:COSAG06_NODE_16871_length_976_cov_0.981756_1_plen_325_part_11